MLYNNKLISGKEFIFSEIKDFFKGYEIYYGPFTYSYIIIPKTIKSISNKVINKINSFKIIKNRNRLRNSKIIMELMKLILKVGDDILC